MAGSKYIAIDWGTTNRRAFLMDDDGSVLDTERDDHGVLASEPEDYARGVLSYRERWGMEPVFIAGMAGSPRGWFDVPYVDCPADASTVAGGMVAAPIDDVRMIPGVAYRSDTRCDVMRGEEVQILGAISAGFAPGDALFCQPGTHNKWIWTRAGRIDKFTSVMTGELFALLSTHGLLAEMLTGDVADTQAFRSGVEHGAEARSLGAVLFQVRASVLLGRLDVDDAAAYASGVLIGNDLSACDGLSGQTVHLLGSGDLGDLYSVAIGQLGGTVVPIDSHAAFAAGILLLRKQEQ